ncbi:MAG: sigma-70 family RNA polymerase sigma factor [Acidimicrobiia bacterium]|nr:sigma-70 family RNA polymerase sigma factor [Acidimicrobiia bacterium]
MSRGRTGAMAHNAGRSRDALQQYLDEIGSIALLPPTEEIALARTIENGVLAELELTRIRDGGITIAPKRRAELRRTAHDGEQARRRFIEANLRLVVSIAKRHARSGVPLLDLSQEGNLGLIRAVEKFDYRKGFKFSTYASWWIKQAVARAIADKGRTIRLPVHMVEAMGQVARARTESVNRTGIEPSSAALADATGIPEPRVEEAMRLAPQPISLSVPVGDDTAVLEDFLADPEEPTPHDLAERRLESQGLRRGMDHLTSREREIIERRFGLDGRAAETLEQIGETLGITRERVRQIQAKALSKLRHPSGYHHVAVPSFA